MIYDYYPTGSDVELEVHRGDSVALRRWVDTSWMICTNIDGASGIVPLSFIKVIEELPASEALYLP